MGTYNRNVFTAIPQLGVQLGYQWTNHSGNARRLHSSLLERGGAGAGDQQIDLNLDLSGANTAPIYAVSHDLLPGTGPGASERSSASKDRPTKIDPAFRSAKVAQAFAERKATNREVILRPILT